MILCLSLSSSQLSGGSFPLLIPSSGSFLHHNLLLGSAPLSFPSKVLSPLSFLYVALPPFSFLGWSRLDISSLIPWIFSGYSFFSRPFSISPAVSPVIFSTCYYFLVLPIFLISCFFLIIRFIPSLLPPLSLLLFPSLLPSCGFRLFSHVRSSLLSCRISLFSAMESVSFFL